MRRSGLGALRRALGAAALWGSCAVASATPSPGRPNLNAVSSAQLQAFSPRVAPVAEALAAALKDQPCTHPTELRQRFRGRPEHAKVRVAMAALVGRGAVCGPPEAPAFDTSPDTVIPLETTKLTNLVQFFEDWTARRRAAIAAVGPPPEKRGDEDHDAFVARLDAWEAAVRAAAVPLDQELARTTFTKTIPVSFKKYDVTTSCFPNVVSFLFYGGLRSIDLYALTGREGDRYWKLTLGDTGSIWRLREVSGSRQDTSIELGPLCVPKERADAMLAEVAGYTTTLVLRGDAAGRARGARWYLSADMYGPDGALLQSTRADHGDR